MHTSAQDYVVKSVRSAAILTSGYVAGTVIGTDMPLYQQNQLVILVDFTIGSLTDASIKVEFSPDNSAFYQESFSSISAGVDTVSLGSHKFTGTGKYRIAIPLKDRYVKISAIGNGTATNSTMTIDAIVGVA